MPSEKSPRRRSTPEELHRALNRAVRALQGTSVKMTRNSVAHQAAKYVPEEKTVFLKILMPMPDEEFARLIAPKATVGAENSTLPAEATRPIRSGDWVLGRNNF